MGMFLLGLVFFGLAGGGVYLLRRDIKLKIKESNNNHAPE